MAEPVRKSIKSSMASTSIYPVSFPMRSRSRSDAFSSMDGLLTLIVNECPYTKTTGMIEKDKVVGHPKRLSTYNLDFAILCQPIHSSSIAAAMASTDIVISRISI